MVNKDEYIVPLMLRQRLLYLYLSENQIDLSQYISHLLSLQYVNTLISTFAAWCVLMIRNVMLGDKIANRRYICRTILGQGQSPEARLTGMHAIFSDRSVPTAMNWLRSVTNDLSQSIPIYAHVGYSVPCCSAWHCTDYNKKLNYR